MMRAILSAALAIAFVVGVSAQDKPDFTGKWKPDPGRSKTIGGLGPAQTITVEGSKMTIIRTVAGNSSSTVYMLDGTPSKNNLSKDGVEIEQIYSSKWEDNVLVTTITTGNSTRIERRSIEADGTMKIGSTITVQGKPVSPPPLVLKKIG